MYALDPQSCLPMGGGAKAEGVLAHQFYLWHDPRNPNRLLVLSQTYGSQDEDLIVTAVTTRRRARCWRNRCSSRHSRSRASAVR
jgi:hypothetical protein